MSPNHHDFFNLITVNCLWFTIKKLTSSSNKNDCRLNVRWQTSPKELRIQHYSLYHCYIFRNTFPSCPQRPNDPKYLQVFALWLSKCLFSNKFLLYCMGALSLIFNGNFPSGKPSAEDVQCSTIMLITADELLKLILILWQSI